ncbi:TonB-dependent receptor [Emticicia sp. CRIBPO]|uniref:TonB-dependent receptor n=1 Tax=Emticicia sp. CRIBPO TaxID=2683258 RepID=UPI001E2CADEC|nr:TonB-dependent receptor [Emticicia sp. CRIBPO]
MKKTKHLLFQCMKVSLVQLFFICLFAGVSWANNAGAQELLNRKISLIVVDEKIKSVLSSIEKSANVKFSYSPQVINSNRRISFKAQNSSLGELLNQMLTPLNIVYSVAGNQIILVQKSKGQKSTQSTMKAVEEGSDINVQVADQSVSGTVTDVAGEKLPGVSISVKGTTRGTSTDADGKYKITVPDEKSVLVFSFVGFTSQEIVVGNQTVLNISLKSDAKLLSEVVVVGYGVQKKANLTGAVDQITSEVFDNRPMTNINQGLQGVLPNLNIKMMDGKPNQAPSFNIRGTTSIGQGGSALVLIDNVEGDPSLINPSDIASITLLKDAASASIYGARGVFGVVLITTKSPSAGKTSVTYSTNYSSKRPTAVPKFVNDGYLWASMFAESFVNREGSFPQNVNKTLKFSQAYLAELKRRSEVGGLPDTEIDPVTGEYVYYASTDHYKELYKDRFNAIEHNLSISGSSEKSSYLLTGRYYGQDGLFRYNSDDYKIFNFSGKGSVQLYPWLKVNNFSQFSDMSYYNPLNVGEGGGIWRNIADEGHPMSPIFNPDGTLTASSAYTVGDFIYGKNGIDQNKRVFRNTSGFAMSFLKDKFRIKGDFTIQNTDNNDTRKRVPVPFSSKPGVISYVGTTTNDITETFRETTYMTTNLYSEYENTFKDDHYFKFMVGYNYEQSNLKRIQAQRNGLIFQDAMDLNLALGQSIVTQGGWETWKIMGGFSRLNYAYKDRYLFEVNGRYDGSSKFPANQRYAFFPSFSAGWRLSKESFWKLSERIVSDLKIRASYGSLGNGNIGSYVYQEQFNIAQSGLILNGVKPQYTNNPTVLPEGLTWETATTKNIGIDLSMLSNRLNFVGDAYIRNTTDMFTVGLTLPAVFGATAPKGNYADLETKGWEMMLSWRDKFMVNAKPFNYDVRLTLSDYSAVITKYNNPQKQLSDYYEGQKLGEIWGYTTAGFFTSAEDIKNSASQSLFRTAANGLWFPGDIKFADTNGDGQITPGTSRLENPGDRSIIGNSTPRYTYGVMLGADWNNFFFSSFFQGVGKQDWYPSSEANIFWGQYNRPYGDIPVSQLGNIWTETNPNAYFPRYVSRLASNANGTLIPPQTRYLQNVAYLRLKNIQLGYNIPRHLTSKIGSNAARIFVSAENLWTYSPLYKITKDLDVESAVPSDQVLTTSNNGDGYNYPMMKSFTCGLSITF